MILVIIIPALFLFTVPDQILAIQSQYDIIALPIRVHIIVQDFASCSQILFVF